MIEIKTLEYGGYKLRCVEENFQVVEVLRKPPADLAREKLRRAISVYLDGCLNPPNFRQTVNCLNQRPPASKNPQPGTGKPSDFDCSASENKTSVKNEGK